MASIPACSVSLPFLTLWWSYFHFFPSAVSLPCLSISCGSPISPPSAILFFLKLLCLFSSFLDIYLTFSTPVSFFFFLILIIFLLLSFFPQFNFFIVLKLQPFYCSSSSASFVSCSSSLCFPHLLVLYHCSSSSRFPPVLLCLRSHPFLLFIGLRIWLGFFFFPSRKAYGHLKGDAAYPECGFLC